MSEELFEPGPASGAKGGDGGEGKITREPSAGADASTSRPRGGEVGEGGEGKVARGAGEGEGSAPPPISDATPPAGSSDAAPPAPISDAEPPAGSSDAAPPAPISAAEPHAGSSDAAPPAPGYLEPQRVYADRYGASLRTIKLWVAEGREFRSPEHPHGFPPPLDDAEAMLGWWHEVKHNRTPPRLLVAAETARAARATVGEGGEGKVARGAGEGEGSSAAGSSEAAAPPAGESQASGGSSASTQTTTRATGFAASLERVRIAEAEAHGRYLDALAEPDETKRNDAKIERLRKAWSELSEQLRFLEKAAPDVLAKSGEMITRAEARRILGELHGPIVSGVRSLFRRVRAKAGTAPTLDDLERLYTEETERLFGALCASEFAPISAPA